MNMPYKKVLTTVVTIVTALVLLQVTITLIAAPTKTYASTFDDITVVIDI